jgi:hypothetical protein
VGPGHDSHQPRATTLGQQQHLTPPRGRLRGRHVYRESDILQGINSESEPPWESAGPLDIQSGPPSWSRTPTCTDRTPRMGYGPPHMGSGPPTVGSQGSRTEHTWALLGPRGGPELTRVQTWSGVIRTYPYTLLLPTQAETRCCHVAYCAWHKPTGGT